MNVYCHSKFQLCITSGTKDSRDVQNYTHTHTHTHTHTEYNNVRHNRIGLSDQKSHVKHIFDNIHISKTGLICNSCQFCS